MAQRLGTSAKTFARDVRTKGIPHMVVGHRRRFDPLTVEAFLMATEVNQNVVKFPVRVAKKTDSKFAQAVGM